MQWSNRLPSPFNLMSIYAIFNLGNTCRRHLQIKSPEHTIKSALMMMMMMMAMAMAMAMATPMKNQDSFEYKILSFVATCKLYQYNA